MERYLLFDASCAFCTQLARSMQEQSGGWIHDVRDLRHPDTRQLLESRGRQELWEPALVEVQDDQAHVFTGMRLRVHLLRGLGPSRAWHVWRLMTHGLSAAGERDPDRHDGALSEPGRRRFLARAGGVLAGVAVASGVGSRSLAHATTRDGDWLARLSLGGAKELSGDELAAAWSDFRSSEELRRMLSAGDLAGDAGVQRFKAALGSGVSRRPEEFLAVRHSVATGGELIAAVFRTSDTVVANYRLRTEDQSHSRILVLRPHESDGTVRKLARMEDGTLLVPSGASTAQACNSQSDCPGQCVNCSCNNWNTTCLANCCAPCAFACGTPATCIGCIVVWCPVCSSINRCCRSAQCELDPSCQ